jgi:uncharacterized protein (DUF1697 family)
MPRYVALLRGINLGGHTVKMDRLRKLFEELGLKNVGDFGAQSVYIAFLFEKPPKESRRRSA